MPKYLSQNADYYDVYNMLSPQQSVSMHCGSTFFASSNVRSGWLDVGRLSFSEAVSKPAKTYRDVRRTTAQGRFQNLLPVSPQVPGNMERVQENMYLLDGREVDLETDKRHFETKLTQGETLPVHRARLFLLGRLDRQPQPSQQFLLRDQGPGGRVLFAFQAAQESTPRSTSSSIACATRTRGTSSKARWATTGCSNATRKGSTRTVPN